MQSSLSTPAFKNIVGSPYCTCGAIEDTHHFLFVCHQIRDLRRNLIHSVSDICQPNLNVLLCGDISLTFDQNKQILKAVHEFIIKSKRFEYTYKSSNNALHSNETYLNVCNNSTIYAFFYTNSDAPISHFICRNHISMSTTIGYYPESWYIHI